MSSFIALSSREELLPLSSLTLEKLREGVSPAHRLHSLADRIELNRALAEAGQQPFFQAARINLGTNPTHQDTLTIGGDVYEFINTGTGTVVADDGNVAVAIGGSAAATFTNLVAAINGTAAAEHATITMADEETPAIGVGSQRVYAFNFGSSVLGVTYSTARGVDPNDFVWSDYANMPATLPSIALDDDLTAAVAWSHTNMNTLLYFNPVHTTRGLLSFKRVLTAADAAAGTLTIYCPGILKTGNPSIVVMGYTTAGVPKLGAADVVAWDATNGAVVVTLTGGGSDWAATDVLHFIVAGPTSTQL